MTDAPDVQRSGRGSARCRIVRAAAAACTATAIAACARAPDAPAPAAGELLVTLLHTSDEHSALLPTPFVEYRADRAAPTRGGMARLASVVEAVRARKAETGEPVLVTSAGDHIGGSPFAWLALAGAAAELGLMVEIGYDAVTIGNHEFDYGADRLAAYYAAAGYPDAATRTAVVAANTVAPPGHPLRERGIRRTHVIELHNGLRVGLLGLLGAGAARFATLAAPVEFADAHAAATEAVAELRGAGAHLVVALTHAGLAEDRALARAVPGIDVILGGHDHRLLDAPMIEAGTLIMHPGAHLRQLAQLELAVDTTLGRVRLRNADTGAPLVLALDERVPEHAAVAARVDAYRRQLDGRIAELSGGRFGAVDSVIAHSDFPLRAGPPFAESGFGNFVTDAMRAAAETATGAHVDVVFEANGVIRGDVEPGRSPSNAGQITVYDLAGTVGMGAGPDGLPGYPLVSVWLTGDEVRRVLEVATLLSGLLGNSYFLQVAGVRAEYDPRRAVWARIPVRGTPIPSGRAVTRAERVHDGARAPIERGDTALLHVVTDRYVASFLPMVGRVVPSLAMVPRDRAGRPIDDIDEAIVYRDGRELKVWQAVLEFAAAQPPGADGVPRIAAEYAAPAGRLVRTRALPLWLGPAAAVLLVVALAVWIALRRRRSARPVRARGSARRPLDRRPPAV